MGEPLDHRPPGWIRQSRKCCIQLIHNRMVVDFRSMSTANFAILDYCSLISLNPDTRAKLFPAATSATSPMLTGGVGISFGIWGLTESGIQRSCADGGRIRVVGVEGMGGIEEAI
jgi:hypothetical protein